MIVCLVLATTLLFINLNTDNRTWAYLSREQQLDVPVDVIISTHTDDDKQKPVDTTKKEAPKPEKRHIAFLKVHKAASSTVQNIFYRFGSMRNLSFVLPYTTHYLSQLNSRIYNPILPSLDNKTGKYDIVCNHVNFNHSNFKRLMYDDAVYLAIVREPLDLFVSAAYYYKYVWPAGYLKVLNETTFIQDLIRNPEKLEPRQTRTFNYMAQDFGFVIKSVPKTLALNETVIANFISGLKESFHFVMVVEYFDESLIMMKRLLNWSFKDILYIKLNKLNEYKRRKGIPNISLNISTEDKLLFRKRNRIDCAIYDSFLELFLKRMSTENGLRDEVGEFRKTLKDVHEFCTDAKSADVITLPATKWNPMFVVDRHDCKLMMTEELAFWETLKKKHKLLLGQM